MRAHKIDLSGRKSWCVSNDPEFAAKAAEIVGLCMAPPDNAIVLAVDEKPSIQALEPAQGYLKLPNGRSMMGSRITCFARSTGSSTFRRFGRIWSRTTARRVALRSILS